MIKLENVSFSFKSEPILQHLNLNVNDGEFIGIVGPNGAGKTTLIKLILGILKPTEGKIIKTDKSISYVSQTTGISDTSMPSTVQEIVSLGLTKNKPAIFNHKKNNEVLQGILKETGILELRNRLITELSGGQLQKVKIAKALISSPSLIVLDEPDAGMDEKSHSNLIKTINSLNKERKITIIFISHHMDDLINANHIYLVDNKSVTELKGGENYVSI
ncbi:MAG: ATP-binding cassette domain-containing protein [Erysipelotrichaceae bacterium]|nr:ATP-binding cassette domain-containing protein [Erysipelotrichaceae bacterium]